MTTPEDTTRLELLAACDALAETTERSVRVVHALAESHILGKRPTDAVLNGYTDEAERSSENPAEFRALVRQFKSSIRVH